MNLTATPRETGLLVTVEDRRIDAAIAIAFKDRMRELTDNGPERIVLDLTKVDFVDSSGLGAIVATMKALGGDRKLELAGLTPTVDKVFRLTRMDTVFAIYPNTDVAFSVSAA